MNYIPVCTANVNNPVPNEIMTKILTLFPTAVILPDGIDHAIYLREDDYEKFVEMQNKAKMYDEIMKAV